MNYPFRLVCTLLALIITVNVATMALSAAPEPVVLQLPAHTVVPQKASNNVSYLPFIVTPSWITNVANGGSVAQTMTLIGSYPSSVTEDLWIFVVSPNGLYYPQSLDACIGEPTPKIRGRWEMRVNFGEADDVGQTFRIVVTTATSATSQFVADTLKGWCQMDNYPGFTQLPESLTIWEQLTVTRTSERWGPAPDISNTTFPGGVTINSPTNGTLVSQEAIIQGIYTADVTTDIRVLVYASDGRWYPQSYDACADDHVHRGGGHWNVRATFGDEMSVGEPFDIVVVLVSPEARGILDQKEREWCVNNTYTGWLTIELPQGIHSKQHIRVYRK